MTDHPSTYKGNADHDESIAWDDHASLLPVERKDGVFARTNAVRSGTFAEIIRHIAALPPEEREGYVIEKAGDREYSADEAIALAARDDFPQSPEEE
ncbi:MAG: hypothetical protein V2J14_00460 [Erythrobacter sp.]|jgi:hypothetical protein|nr:hypothetical protein [Erythrobacter sp.]